MALQITGLEEQIIEWGIDQALGKKLGEEVNQVINPIAAAIAAGNSPQQALISVALNELSTVKGAGALVPVISAVITEVEAGKSIKEALTAAVASLL